MTVRDSTVLKAIEDMIQDEREGANKYVRLLYLLENSSIPIPESLLVGVAKIINDEIQHEKTLNKLLSYV